MPARRKQAATSPEWAKFVFGVLCLYAAYFFVGAIVSLCRGEPDETTSRRNDPDDVSAGGQFIPGETVRDARAYGYDYFTGKPTDMSKDEWEYSNRLLIDKGMSNRKDRQESVRAIWGQERIIRKQLE